MDLWVSFWSALTDSISENGLLTVAVIVLLRSAAIPIPIPADLLVVMVGAHAREQGIVLGPAWLVLSAATTIGAVLFYVFVRWIGQADAIHYGHYVGLTNERLNSAQAQLVARGGRAVFVARIVPGFRLAIVAVCGMLRFSWWKFVAAVGLGALLYVGLCLVIGYIFGEAIVELVGYLVFPVGLLESLVGLSILLFWLIRARRAHAHSAPEAQASRSKRLRHGVLAGLLAISGSTMLVNAFLYLAAPIAATFLGGRRGLESIVTSPGGLGNVLEGLLGSVMLGIAWGAVYAVGDGRWGAGWPDWLRGLAFAAFPFTLVSFMQLVVIPQRDRSLADGLVLGTGEVVRWGAYGVLIGLIYPVLHTPRVHPKPGVAPSVALDHR